MASRQPESSYRRRVLSLGGLAAFALYVVGAPIFNNRIEDDLEQRVPAELAAAGIGGITAKFSGQDGTLTCQAPLADPEGTLDAAYEVWGVRSVELDRSCRVSTAAESPTSGDSDTTAGSGTAGTVSDSADTSTANSSDDSSATTVGDTVVDYPTLFDALAADPQFSSFALLVSESEISDELSTESAAPVTVFAPSNDAFEEVAPDMLAILRSEPSVRDRVLRSHMVSGNLAPTDLVTGSLTALDGTELEVINEGGLITVGGATVTGGPFTATNGAVYSINQVLVPDDVAEDLAPTEQATVDATFDNGTITLAGVVDSEAARQQLVNTAAFGVAAANVIDTLAVDAAQGVSAERAAILNELIVAMRLNLVAGSVGVNGTEWYVNGTYATEANRDAVAAASEAAGATTSLEPRPMGTAETAAELESDLNAYVAANPILFEQSSAVLEPSADAILARITATILEVGGVTTAVEGHTDSDGSAATNLSLSQERAAVVADSLVARGLPADTVTSEGFGSEQPVLVDGVEDKPASRRVEFRIAVSQ